MLHAKGNALKLAPFLADPISIRSLGYEYDDVGMITKKRISNNEQGTPNVEVDYTYDSLDRLVAERRTAGGAGSTSSYTYDLAGNRLSKNENGVETTYALGTGNRLSSATQSRRTEQRQRLRWPYRIHPPSIIR